MTDTELENEVVTTEETEVTDVTTEEKIDYAKIAEEDAATLSGSFPELRGLKSVGELEDPLRYAALRDLGLTPEEAYLATSRNRRVSDNRAHLTPSIPREAAHSHGGMTAGELDMARDLFPDMSDAQIQKLYKSVTK